MQPQTDFVDEDVLLPDPDVPQLDPDVTQPDLDVPQPDLDVAQPDPNVPEPDPVVPQPDPAKPHKSTKSDPVKFLKYVERMYVGKNGKLGMFPKQHWNCAEEVFQACIFQLQIQIKSFCFKIQSK